MIYAPIPHGPLMEILNTHALFERVSLHNWLQGTTSDIINFPCNFKELAVICSEGRKSRLKNNKKMM
jgi:hypothetical protein